LFSSTSSEPLSLFSTSTDPGLPNDSFIHLLDDNTSLPIPHPAHIPISDDSPGRNLDQTVLHIQSPTLRTTYLRCPPAANGSLGITHPWIHLQVKNLGREFSFELGVIDRAGRGEGIIRFSTFQVSCTLCTSIFLLTDVQKNPKVIFAKCAILHLPLSFPPPSSRPLTSWSTITLNIASLIPYFSSASLVSEDSSNPGAPVPRGSLSNITYIKIYATCRLRRIWFSEDGSNQQLPWEFQLYSIA
jgi:hypothetical protein